MPSVRPQTMGQRQHEKAGLLSGAGLGVARRRLHPKAKRTMKNQTEKLVQLSTLRQRAQSRLSGPRQAANVSASASAALSVLHRLAASPETAAQALALLHELQVHQVEIDMQADELRTSLAGADAALNRQLLYHDSMPVACINIDSSCRLLELNQTAAKWLGLGREALLGQTLHAFLAPDSKLRLLAQLAIMDRGGESLPWDMILLADGQAPRTVQAAMSADPAGGRYILVLMAMPAGAAR